MEPADLTMTSGTGTAPRIFLVWRNRWLEGRKGLHSKIRRDCFVSSKNNKHLVHKMKCSRCVFGTDTIELFLFEFRESLTSPAIPLKVTLTYCSHPLLHSPPAQFWIWPSDDNGRYVIQHELEVSGVLLNFQCVECRPHAHLFECHFSNIPISEPHCRFMIFSPSVGFLVCSSLSIQINLLNLKLNLLGHDLCGIRSH